MAISERKKLTKTERILEVKRVLHELFEGKPMTAELATDIGTLLSEYATLLAALP